MNLSINKYLIGIFLLLAAGFAIVLKPVPIALDKRPNLEIMIPTQFDDWKIEPNILQVTPNATTEKQVDEIYDQLVSRTYVNSKGERIMLTVGYGARQTQELKAHRQEVCYTSQGFTINNLHNEMLTIAQRSVPVTRMFAVKNSRMEPVTYWFTMGGKVVLTRFERFMLQIKFGLSGQIPDGVLVRISNFSDDPLRSYQTHIDFFKELIGANPEAISQLLGHPD